MAGDPVYLEEKNLVQTLAFVATGFMKVAITPTGATGGATAASVSIQVKDLTGVDLLVTRRFRLILSDTEKLGSKDAAATAQVGAASTGTVLFGAGTAEAIIETDSNGLYEGALDNAADETCWVCVAQSDAGSVGNTPQILAAGPEASVTWSA